MASFKYLVSRVMKMDYKNMLSKINSIHKKTDKSRISIFNDMRECAVKYGAGYSDYDLFEMYNLTDEERDTYITRGRNNELFKNIIIQNLIIFLEIKLNLILDLEVILNEIL